nr:unnamed protein product [Callosobruchus analis]
MDQDDKEKVGEAEETDWLNVKLKSNLQTVPPFFLYFAYNLKTNASRASKERQTIVISTNFNEKYGASKLRKGFAKRHKDSAVRRRRTATDTTRCGVNLRLTLVLVRLVG